MTIEVPEWIVKDIVDNYSTELHFDAWLNDDEIDFNSQAFKDFVSNRIEYAYRDKDLDIAIENFLYDWKNNVRHRPIFEIIFKDEYNGR